MHRNSRLIKSGFNNAGFSMVELIVVIAVISILSTIIFSGLGKWVPNYRLKGAAQELHSSMQRAKAMAIKSNRNVGIEFTTVGCPPEGGGYRMFIDNNKDNTMNGADTSFYSATLGGGVCLSSTTFTGNRAGFTARGVASGGTGAATLGHIDITRTYKISLLVSGGVKMD